MNIKFNEHIIIEPEEQENQVAGVKIGVFWQFLKWLAMRSLNYWRGNMDVLQYVIPYSQAQNLTILDKAEQIN